MQDRALYVLRGKTQHTVLSMIARIEDLNTSKSFRDIFSANRLGFYLVKQGVCFFPQSSLLSPEKR